jgi:hypothetical protein
MCNCVYNITLVCYYFELYKILLVLHLCQYPLGRSRNDILWGPLGHLDTRWLASFHPQALIFLQMRPQYFEQTESRHM